MKQTILIALVAALAAGTADARPKPLLSGASAAADSPATAGQNAAGLTRFDSTNLRFDLYYLDSESTWRQEFGDTGFATTTTTESDLTVPNGSIVVPINDKWYFGASMLAYSVSDDYGDEWIGRYIIKEYDLVFISAAPSIAYKINDQWSVAATALATYTSFTQEAAVRNLASDDDGELEIEADGFTAGYGFSLLYELSERTRFGLTYQSELEPELDGDVDFSGLDDVTENILDQVGLLNATIDADTRSPQKVAVGVYHEFDNRHAITADINWIDFSEFKLAEVYVNVNGNTAQITKSDFDYDDIWAYSLGYSFPLNDRWLLAVAGLYAPDMVDDDDRSLSLRLDEIWAVGAGVEYRLNDRWKLDATLSYIEVGDSPITTAPIDAIGGPVRGKFTDRELWILQFGVEWGNGPRG